MDNVKEKRRTPRVAEKLAIKVMEGDRCVVVETKNISDSGVYFTSDQPMIMMSKVIITLLLPNRSGKNQKVECGGIVVRVFPVSVEGRDLYETAIFFDEINEKAKGLISRHVKKAISQQHD